MRFCKTQHHSYAGITGNKTVRLTALPASKLRQPAFSLGELSGQASAKRTQPVYFGNLKLHSTKMKSPSGRTPINPFPRVFDCT